MNARYRPVLFAAFCAVVSLLAASHRAEATALTLGDSHELGFVNYGIPSGDADRTNYVNYLIGMPLGTTASAEGQSFSRSNNFFGPLPTAVFGLDGTSTSINVGTDMYSYLFAKYDGPNYGSEVWYIGNLSGTLTIPKYPIPGSEKYALSGWTLFGPGTTTSTPEPGTLLLFAAGLAGLGFALRRRTRQT